MLTEQGQAALPVGGAQLVATLHSADACPATLLCRTLPGMQAVSSVYRPHEHCAWPGSGADSATGQRRSLTDVRC
jgi:hypothetical protein